MFRGYFVICVYPTKHFGSRWHSLHLCVLLLFFPCVYPLVIRNRFCFFRQQQPVFFQQLFTCFHMLSDNSSVGTFQLAGSDHFRRFFRTHIFFHFAMMDRATISSYSTGQLLQLILVIIQELCSRFGIEIGSESTFTFQFPAASFQQLVASDTEAPSTPEP